MARLHEALEEDVKHGLRTDELRTFTPENINDFITRGKALMASIYGPRTDIMRAKMYSYHPDLAASIEEIYATVFASFPEESAVQGNLSRALNSVVAVACLRTEGGVVELLNGHVLGLLRARDVPGLTTEDYWLASEEGVDWVLMTVDMLLGALKSNDSD
ncbi:Dol-P-Man:Man(5)GlcNAc(2)-PP-Dol alpha-1,3-mannosyltransferase [Trametes pubescens]|uniref:Dol-P-Man:Man(5)GlcNAc(2)-PP-Dol alpha-1,3-mannosyltransferase n=1 Tax=Trametes pubescens TaxID=154538 RepID=A0A1M2V2H0_TRAPU|nr:Dol-P-Man:Man(5)GlcNAc(2)-PP-Dol alpha-1,3-mannosyltransferase [Trametes pubescens]